MDPDNEIIMTYKYRIQSSSCCLPYSRIKLYQEIFEFRTCGEIHGVWMGAGHLFVSVNGGKQLFSFDCKTVDNIQDVERTGCLDICEDIPVLKVLLKPPNAVFVILQNGLIQYWIYKPDCVWKQQTRLRLCHGSLVTVVDVCYNVSQNAIYWCQKEESEIIGKSNFMIYKRQVIEGNCALVAFPLLLDQSDVELLKQGYGRYAALLQNIHCSWCSGDEDENKGILKLGPASPIIKNCAQCSVYPIGHGIIFVTETGENKALFIVRLCTLLGQIHVLVDQDWIMIRNVNAHSPLRFNHIVIKCLQYLNKLKNLCVVGTSYIAQTQTLHVLYNSGKLCAVSHTQDKRGIIVQLEGFRKDGLVGMSAQAQTVGLAYPECIRQYCVHTGALLGSVDVPYSLQILGVAHTLLGGVQQAVYTEDNLLVLQKYPGRKNTSEVSLLEMSHFQSDAVRLSYVEKMQKHVAVSSGLLSLESLQKKWIDSLGTPPTSKLVETVDPYLTQYWKLEKLLQEGLQDPNKISPLSKQTIEEEVNYLLDPKSPVSRPTRQSQLVLLAQHCPVEVIGCLITYLHITDGEMSTSQHQKWQCALTEETCSVAGSCDIAVPLFELMCHLLYKHKPDKLVEFVSHGQRVWDQKVGMSAFVRQRRIPFIYERALKCIPQPEHSTNPGTAILAYVHILLTSEMHGCFTKALHLLLRAEKWSETINLLKEYRDNCPQFGLLYQMTLTALTKKQVLHLYADQIFSLMPSLSCASNVVEGSQEELATTKVLCESADDISVESVRSHLINCLHTHNTTPA